MYVARLVHHLRGRVELRYLLHDLRGVHQRVLLAVQELRQLRGLEMVAQARPAGGVEALQAGEP